MTDNNSSQLVPGYAEHRETRPTATRQRLGQGGASSEGVTSVQWEKLFFEAKQWYGTFPLTSGRIWWLLSHPDGLRENRRILWINLISIHFGGRKRYKFIDDQLMGKWRRDWTVRGWVREVNWRGFQSSTILISSMTAEHGRRVERVSLCRCMWMRQHIQYLKFNLGLWWVVTGQSDRGKNSN